MQDSEEFKKQVTTNLRACLISSQGGIPANSLNNDYKQLLGEPIPFRKLGFTNLESFLKSIPEINLKNVNGTTLVEAKKTACSTHITKLVEKQRKGGRRRSRKSNKLKCPPRPKGRPFTAPRFEKSGLGDREKPPPPTMNNQENQTRAYKSPPPVFHAPKSPPIKLPNLPNFTPMPAQFTNPNIVSPSPQYSFMVPTTLRQFHLCPQPHVTSVPSSSMSSIMPPLMRNVNPTLMLKQQTLGLRRQFRQFPPQQDIPPLMSGQQLSSSKKKSKISAQKRLEALKKIKLDIKNSNNLANFRTVLPIPTDLSEDSYYYKLLDLVNDRGWPEPEVSLSQQKGGNIICTVSIKCSKPGEQSYMNIGEQQFTTYPDEIRDPYLALEEGSKKAVIAITKNSPEDYEVTNDSDLILTRIAEMVQDKSNGVWAFQIEKDYKEKFHESLPPKWIDVVMNSNILMATDLGQSYVVKPLNDQDSFSNHGGTSSEAEFLEYYDEDITSNRNLPQGSNTKNCFKDEAKISPNNQIVIPKLILPTSEQWDVFISRAQSYSEIWIRLVGEEYSQKLEDLTTDLELHYLNDNSRVLPQIDKYYAAVCDESVYRIIVKEIYKNEALVHFVDYGDDEIILLSAIKELLPKFCSLPSQALLVNLSGLEYTSKLDYREDIMDMIIGKSYVGFVEEREPYYLVLFDTSTSIDVDINEILIDSIFSETLYQPMVLKIGAVTEVRVTHVDSRGQVFIQLTNNPALDFLQERLEDIYKEEYENNKIIKLNFNKIYLIKQMGKLQRVTVLPTTNFLKDNIEVFFVDEGKTESVCITELSEVADTYGVLSKIPHQAKRIYLKDIPPVKLTKNKINKLREIAPPNRPVISKVVEIVSSSETDIPVLELFIRNQTDRLLSSVNHSIELEDLLERSNGESAEIHQFENLRINDSVAKKVDNFPARTLMPTHIEDRDIFVWNGKGDLLKTHRAEIPAVEEKYFEIYVDDAANPTNFTVQPLKYLFELNNLTKEMKQFYDKTKPVLNNPYQFEVYAVKTCDGYWYRASVHRILNDDITVRLCDFGHLDVVSLGSMRPLHKNFMTLPFLGFKATLAGISAKYKDWNASDCIRIKELIKGKKFNSIIKEVAHLKDEMILSLEITDTSSSIDINIAHQLVIEGIAVYI